MSTMSTISQPYSLPNGLTLPNRLVKAAMAENMGSRDGLPTPAMNKVYRQWGEGGWGLILTGNVQIDGRHLGNFGDVYLNTTMDQDEQLAAWKQWAAACNASSKTPTVVQINHPGRQSPIGAGSRPLWGKALAPSAVPLKLGTSWFSRVVEALVFGTPQAMTTQDVEDIVAKFVATARLAAEAGFAGVEVHAAHGYLLAQFLSDASNRRTDVYGGTAAKRAQIVVDIVRAIRKATSEGGQPQFTVGIKINSVDQQAAPMSEFLEQLRLIVDAGVDFVEISGGTYEEPKMMANTPKTAKTSPKTAAREAFFLDFAQAIRQHFPDVPLMVTGGFRTRAGMESAVVGGGCNLVGIGRPAALYPDLPSKIICNADLPEQEAQLAIKHIEAPWLMKALGMAAAVGGGATTNFYKNRIQELAK